MYHAADLNRYPYFRDSLSDVPLSAVVDTMTGLVARTCMLDFIRDLIARSVPFTLALVDLDNFKHINDHYGHVVGDEVLRRISDDLSSWVGDRGIVGRYGGDEFLIVHFGAGSYEAVHRFYERMYAEGPLRRTLEVGNARLFVTATTGSASFPGDARDFDGLFSLIDRVLYRGKSKGRNCYIIYLSEKHQHLEIPRLARKSLVELFTEMTRNFDAGGTIWERLCRMFSPMKEYLHFHHLYYLDADGTLLNAESGRVEAKEKEAGLLSSGRMQTLVSPEEMKRLPPDIFAFFSRQHQESVLIHSVENAGAVRGWLLFCPEPRTLHIWQDAECASVFLFVRELERALIADPAALTAP